MSKIVVLGSGSLAQLNPEFSGFAHGFGIFETIRLAGGRLEFWKAHYERLLQSANAFGLRFDRDEEAILQAIRELIQSEKLRDGIVKLSLLNEGAEACCYVYTRPAEPSGEYVKLHLNAQSPLNEHSLLAGHKTHNYMEAIYLKQLARRAGFFDVVRLNTSGCLSETAVANLFFIKDLSLYTPALSTGILPGIIRAEIIEVARYHSITVDEGHYPVEFLKTVDAAFLTNSFCGIVPVRSVDAGTFDVTFDLSHKMVETLKVALSAVRKRKSVTLTDEQIA